MTNMVDRLVLNFTLAFYDWEFSLRCLSQFSDFYFLRSLTLNMSYFFYFLLSVFEIMQEQI